MIYSSDNAKGLQPDAVPSERLLQVHGQLVAVAFGRAALQSLGRRAQEEQNFIGHATGTPDGSLKVVGYARRNLGLDIQVRIAKIFPLTSS